MTNETNKETKTGRHGSAKRPNRLEVSFSDQEWKTVNDLAKKAGEEKITVLARNLILGGGVVEAAVTPEDRRDIAQLSKIGTNLWQLRKDLNDYGVDEQFTYDLQKFSAEFKEILSYYFAKLKSK